ncbi:hypothetical protein CVT26_004395 [Gymnopilus dilepis]|uniref:Uncharacterized protein n=1 Tax=Gymnopilus dilepis TaxID=231916 RepID=A0A409WYD8_9AGAR|nr:hypothetical protein CVT26_004395 [Gymnopilus dilepis]
MTRLITLIPVLFTCLLSIGVMVIRVHGTPGPTVTFRVGVAGVAPLTISPLFLRPLKGCGNGDETIACAPAPTHSCKGDFGTPEGTITVLQTIDPLVWDCHISLYPKAGQQGGVLFRMNASGEVGSCVETGQGGLFESFGVYCDLS